MKESQTNSQIIHKTNTNHQTKEVSIIKNSKNNQDNQSTEIYLVFALLLIINIVANMDHGTLPAATNEIRKDFNINSEALGLLGSLSYAGTLLGN